MTRQESSVEQGPSFVLKQALIERIKNHGPITFASFMQECLYGRYGFFSLRKARMGEAGSHRGFLNKRTAPDQSPLFGRAMAAQLRATWEKMDKPERFDVVEMGAGTGSLAKEIVGEKTKESWPDFYQALHYTIVEVSPSLIAEEKKNVPHEKVSWILGSAINLPLRNIEGVIISNELVDAFPFHRVIDKEGKLQEVYINVEQGNLVEVYSEPSTPKLQAYLKKENIELGEGQDSWINLNAVKWMQNLGFALRKGFIITIDYGDLAKSLYHPLSIYSHLLQHQMQISIERPGNKALLAKPGDFDITSGVDFTSLIETGTEVGLELIALIRQSEFLGDLLGLSEVLTLMVSHLPSDPQKRQEAIALIRQTLPLINPRSNGWKVLIQKKGITQITPTS